MASILLILFTLVLVEAVEVQKQIMLEVVALGEGLFISWVILLVFQELLDQTEVMVVLQRAQMTCPLMEEAVVQAVVF